jgi:hypothetical protein
MTRLRLLNFMESPRGRIVMSIILALGLASLLRMSFQNANMVIINGPPIEQTEGKIFSFDNKCYSYKTIATSCKNMESNKNNL